MPIGDRLRTKAVFSAEAGRKLGAERNHAAIKMSTGIGHMNLRKKKGAEHQGKHTEDFHASQAHKGNVWEPGIEKGKQLENKGRGEKIGE